MDRQSTFLIKISAGLSFLAWGLWLGGLASVFIFATQFFAQDRETALKAAPMMFVAFERYQILLAAAALVGTLAWRITAKSIRVTIIFWLIACATLPAALAPMLVTSKMEKLRVAGQTTTEAFKKLHGISMSLYLEETIVLLAAGIIMPWALRDVGKCKSATDVAPTDIDKKLPL